MGDTKSGYKRLLARWPKIHAIARILLHRPQRGPYYQEGGGSPDLNLTYRSVHDIFHGHVQSLQEGRDAGSLRFLDVGGGRPTEQVQLLSQGMSYVLLDIEPAGGGVETIVADISSCPLVQDNFCDVVHSDNLFEHIAEPWKAYGEIGRILRPGGICLTRTLFGWPYHPYPADYWRYTHSALMLLAERYGGLVTLDQGYSLLSRRVNYAGGRRPGNRDAVPLDGYGGWLEGWVVYHVGKKAGERKALLPGETEDLSG